MNAYSDGEKISQNVKAHDRIAEFYNKRHGEIYNPTEQRRIAQSLGKAIHFIQTGSADVLALDYGAGTGNITNHLLSSDVRVLAADVSAASLDRISLGSGGSERLQTCVLNGKDLSNFEDNTFDLLTTYSVLHHVPDYLAIIDEFFRVLKPGGVMYIDHEVCPSYWESSKAYRSYLEELGDPFMREYLRATNPNLVDRLKQALARGRLTGPPLRRTGILRDEGDIHITQDDHIMWQDIRNRLQPACEVLIEEDYLLCRERTDPAPVWTKWRATAHDMRMIIARKGFS